MVAPGGGPLPPCGGPDASRSTREADLRSGLTVETAVAFGAPRARTASPPRSGADSAPLPNLETSPPLAPAARAAGDRQLVEASYRRTVGAVDHHRYLPFVDGLRAVSILAVVACHLDLPGFAGGYVGVDIFFVISGYLIINQIIADIASGRFSLFEFGARRAYRILPAFLLVMVSCLVLVTTVFVQPDYTDFASSFFSSALMLVNHYYLAHQGYFDMEAFTKPLLHMWSLAVEEQFYLVAPLILLGLTATVAKTKPADGRRIWVAATAILAVASFAACVALTRPPESKNAAFYLMHARGWEFVAGGVAASLAQLLRGRPRWFSESLAVAGICAIAVAVVLFDADTHYPSYRALLPAVGAMVIIASGLAWPRTVVARALAIRPMVGIGLVSYAWYLWHWPLISFVRTMSFGNRDTVKELAVVALSLVLAVLTYRLLEVPVRNWRRAGRLRPRVIAMLGPACCVSVACAGYLWSMAVAPHLLPTIAGFEFRGSVASEYPSPVHTGMLLGDSHAHILQQTLDDRSRLAGASLSVVAAAGCPPLLQTTVTTHRGEPWPPCPTFFRGITFAGVEFVVIAARWNFYLGLPPSDAYFRSFVLRDERGASSPAGPRAQLAKGLAATISAAKSAGVRRILIIAPLPEFPLHPPYCLMRAIRTGIDACTIGRAAVEARRERTISTLREATAGIEGVRLIDPIDLFCTPTTCQPHQDRTLFFADSNHLSAAGVERFYKAFESDFVWAMTGEEGNVADNRKLSSIAQK
jgi:peptidoglycan/LPS O-acetylase OafA/YrhL